MLIFRKISSVIYGISVFAFIAFIITYFSGLGNPYLISAVIILMYLIGIKFDIFGRSFGKPQTVLKKNR